MLKIQSYFGVIICEEINFVSEKYIKLKGIKNEKSSRTLPIKHIYNVKPIILKNSKGDE